MSDRSTIEWTDATWNPVRGCEKISPGCKHCYAEAFAERFRDVPGHPYEHGFDLRLVPEKLADPLRWREPRTVFVNSMSDLFQDDIPEKYIVDTVRVMELTPWHTYQVLTKRAVRLASMLAGPLHHASHLPNIWWGVSVENRRNGLPRIELLRRTSAKVRFLSIEPLLQDLGTLNLDGIDWVIVGGESGNGARPMKEPWVRSILDQCREASVPFFFKQWGGVHKKKAGRELGGAKFDEMPQRIFSPVPSRATLDRLEREVAEFGRKWESHPLTLRRGDVVELSARGLGHGSKQTPVGNPLSNRPHEAAGAVAATDP